VDNPVFELKINNEFLWVVAVSVLILGFMFAIWSYEVVDRVRPPASVVVEAPR
jgi:hypothetical protein